MGKRLGADSFRKGVGAGIGAEGGGEWLQSVGEGLSRVNDCDDCLPPLLFGLGISVSGGVKVETASE